MSKPSSGKFRLIYLFPAMIDMVIGAVLFIGCVRIAESGGSATAVAAVLVAFFATYILTCLILGRLVTPRNSSSIIIGVTILIILDAGAFILFSGLRIMYLWICFQGIAAACFFVSFQIFMKTAEQSQTAGISRSIALYTFSWSMGLCCGPFVSGYVWEYVGWQWCHGLNALLAATTMVGIILLRRHAHAEIPEHYPSPATVGSAHQPLDYSPLPDFAWLGWVCSGVGCLAFYTIFGLFPSTARAYSVAKVTQGTIIGLLGATQSLVGLSFIRSRIWMYLVKSVFIFGLSGVVGLLLFAGSSSAEFFCLAAICFGIYSGSFFFYLVFHSLVHHTRSSRYVSINEMVVGLCGIVGPLAGGLLADYLGLSAPYYVMAALVAAAVCFQVIIHFKHASQVRKATQEPEFEM